MAKLPISLREVDSRRVGGCQKPKCRFSGTLHRHHVRHEAMWLGIWSSKRKREPRWRAFVDRYHSFLPSDYVILCPNHHAEIHRLYDTLIDNDREVINRPLSKYSWTQAEKLMDSLAAMCKYWLTLETPGVNTRYYGEQKKKKRKPTVERQDAKHERGSVSVEG